MRPIYRRTAAACLAALLLAVFGSCQPVPQPFAHQKKAGNPIVVPTSDFAGVTILPIPGVSETLANRLSEAMADELLSHDIIAGPNSSNRRSRFLQGGISQHPLANGRIRVSVLWDLTDGTGKILGSQETTRTIAERTWSAGDRGAILPLVTDAAVKLAGLIKGRSGEEMEKSRIALHVWPLDGAPPNAVIPLRQAMAKALKQRSYTVTESLEGAQIVIAGTIELGPEEAEPRPIRIVWSVLDPAGQELGKLTQQNALPRQTMQRRWGALAEVIADNAAGGLSDLVLRLPRNALLSREKPAK